MAKQKVKESEWYSLHDIVTQQLFPWCKGIRVVRRVIVTDSSKKKSVMKAQITGVGRGTKYRIYGANIIEFIKQVETGKIQP